MSAKPDADWARQAVAEHIARWSRMLAAQREREARNLRRHAEKAEPRPPPPSSKSTD